MRNLQPVAEISVQQLAEQLQSESHPFLLDVRQPMEHQHAAIPNSYLIPLPQLTASLDDLRQRIPSGTPIVVYCHHGVRSQMGAQVLQQAGFAPVVSLAGGIDAWSLFVDPSVPRY